MFKLMLLMLVIGFGVYKVVNFVFRILFTLSGGKRTSTFNNSNTRNGKQQNRKRKAPNSDLNIDYVPEDPKNKNKKGFSGGDYVDYEEVK